MTPAAYATSAEYLARTGERDIAEVTAGLDNQLAAASRTIELEMKLAPDYFTAHDATYYFQSNGGRTLFLRDQEGLAYCLRSVVDGGIRPDYSRAGTYTDARYRWDLDDAWIWPAPRNYSVTERPIVSLELRRVGAVQVTWWPTDDGSVRIEGAWGWAEVPEAIVELTIDVARDMRDSEAAGLSGRVHILDSGVAIRDETWRTWQSIRRGYGRELRGVPL